MCDQQITFNFQILNGSFKDGYMKKKRTRMTGNISRKGEGIPNQIFNIRVNFQSDCIVRVPKNRDDEKKMLKTRKIVLKME